MGRKPEYTVINCLTCKKQINSPSYRPRKYCSNICYAKLNKGDGHYRYKGGSLHKDGYKVIYISGKRTLEHRHIMEEHIKRTLEKDEVLHHKNGNKLDNRIKNLEIVNRSEHFYIHRPFNPNRKYKKCPTCEVVKQSNEFHKNKYTSDGLATECKPCKIAYQKLRYSKLIN